MPHLRIETNVPRSAVPNDFVTKAVSVLAETLGKPASYCVCTIHPDMLMSFAGTNEPCAIVSVQSIGKLGVEENKKHSKVVFQFIQEQLGVPNDRMYIVFDDQPSSNIGFKGTTFHEIWKTSEKF